MEKDSGNRAECPSPADDPHGCAFFNTGHVIALVTAVEWDGELYTLRYGHAPDPAKTADKLRGLLPQR